MDAFRISIKLVFCDEIISAKVYLTIVSYSTRLTSPSTVGPRIQERGDRRQKKGKSRQEGKYRRLETGDRRQKRVDRRQEIGDRIQEPGDGRE